MFPKIMHFFVINNSNFTTEREYQWFSLKWQAHLVHFQENIYQILKLNNHCQLFFHINTEKSGSASNSIMQTLEVTSAIQSVELFFMHLPHNLPQNTKKMYAQYFSCFTKGK